MKSRLDRISTINSEYMKIVLASYYRYTRNYKYTCTEFNFFDVCACDGKYLFEIEIKITKADLKNEFHKPKHIGYSKVNKNTPNKYYIAITEDMWKDKEVFEIIEKLNPKYGILVITNKGIIIFVKSAKYLHKNIVSDELKEQIVARLSSENISLRQWKFRQKNGTEICFGTK